MEFGVDIDHLEAARHLDARLLRVHYLLASIQYVRQLGAIRICCSSRRCCCCYAIIDTAIARCGRCIRGDRHVFHFNFDLLLCLLFLCRNFSPHPERQRRWRGRRRGCKDTHTHARTNRHTQYTLTDTDGEQVQQVRLQITTGAEVNISLCFKLLAIWCARKDRRLCYVIHLEFAFDFKQARYLASKTPEVQDTNDDERDSDEAHGDSKWKRECLLWIVFTCLHRCGKVVVMLTLEWQTAVPSGRLSFYFSTFTCEWHTLKYRYRYCVHP